METHKMSYFKHACFKKGESFNNLAQKSNYINLVYSRKYCFQHLHHDQHSFGSSESKRSYCVKHKRFQMLSAECLL